MSDPGPRPDVARQASLDALFSAEAAFWRDLYAAESVMATIHRYRSALTLRWVDAFELPLSSPVLEVGCGAGLLSVELARRGLDVEATDPLEAMRDLAGQAAAEAGLSERIRVSSADVHDLASPADRFELVIALGVMPWIDDHAAALAEMARVLGPGGRLIVSTNNRRPLHALADPIRLPVLAPLRDGGRRLVSAIRGEGRPPRARPIGFARPAEMADQLAAVGLRQVGSQAFGFGPFTVLGREGLPDRLGRAIERRLQQRAEFGGSFLAAAASQYLILAEKPSS